MECEELILPDWSPPNDPARAKAGYGLVAIMMETKIAATMVAKMMTSKKAMMIATTMATIMAKMMESKIATMMATTVAIMMETTMASKEQLQLAGGHYLLWTSPLIFVTETATTMMIMRETLLVMQQHLV